MDKEKFTSVADRLLHNLNPEQLQAVTLPEGNALILAGAGSGKTRVLTTRIAWLLVNGYTSPGGVMAVTFTNKAAKEMLTRITTMLPLNARGMWIGTFHGLCNRFLRMHWKIAGLPQTFQILDMQDQLAAIKRMLKNMSVDEERFPPKEVMWFISGAKEKGQRPIDIDTYDPDTKCKVEFYAAYQEQCGREGVVDFGELMLRSYEILRDHADIRQHYQQRFRHILVDEFQDTNRLQYAWLKMFANQQPGQQSSVFVVGDDDQSIYAFRGADINNMSAFQREFQVKDIIKLERNYRSYSNILDAANGLIANNVARLGKNLSTEAGEGEPIRVYEASSDHEEAAWIVDELKQLHREGVERSQIAILYRSNAQSRVLENRLFSEGVPYRVYGGLRFFERAEVKHALAYLRLLENPDDDTSYMRVVNFPPRGIGTRTVEQLQDAAHASGQNLYTAVRLLDGNAANKLNVFNKLIEDIREQTVGCTLREIIEHILDASGLLAHYQKEREGADRIENLKELINAAEAFVTIEGYGRDAVASTVSRDESVAQPQGDAAEGGETISPLAAFLSHASLEAGDNQAQAGQEAIQLMTVHAAKGLEFDCVFITGLEEGLFPHENSLNDIGGLEEERRLMYVAITRARKRLYMSFSQTRMLHGQMRYNMRSRFLDEIPEETMKWLTPRIQPALHNYSRQDFMNWDTPKRDTTVPEKMIAKKNKEASHGLSIGQRVFHNKFGEGTVLTLEGSGQDAKVQVNFPRHGLKWL
ncbi:MAG: UvrD-helicase domain-containing protein, partial [Saezia sp.]